MTCNSFSLLLLIGEGNNLKVHQIFHEKGNMGKVLPEFLSEWTTERVREEGVNVLTKTQVTGVELIGDQLKLKLIDGKDVICEHVVVAIGSEPNVTLAKDSGLEVDTKYGGYLVNAELEARRHLYVVSVVSLLSYDIKSLTYGIFTGRRCCVLLRPEVGAPSCRASRSRRCFRTPGW